MSFLQKRRGAITPKASRDAEASARQQVAAAVAAAKRRAEAEAAIAAALEVASNDG